MRPADRARQEREIALDRIQRQQEEGQLVIRQMTPEERERYGPPKNVPVKRKVGIRKSLSTPHHHEPGVRENT